MQVTRATSSSTHDVTRCAVVHGKVEREGSQAAVAGETERRLFLEHLAMKMNADVGFHVLRTILQHLDTTRRHCVITSRRENGTSLGDTSTLLAFIKLVDYTAGLRPNWDWCCSNGVA